MTEDPRDEQQAPDSEEEEEDAPSTPFDHPFFLPVLLFGFWGWFAWDIFTNAPAYQEYPNFNRGGFAVTLVLAIYFTWRAIQEKRAAEEADSDEP